MNIIMKGYSIKDTKGDSFGPPFYTNTHGEAERTFARMAKNPQSLISEYPEDYDLFYIGEFNTATGQLNALLTPQHIVKASNARKSEVGPLATQQEALNSAMQ